MNAVQPPFVREYLELINDQNDCMSDVVRAIVDLFKTVVRLIVSVIAWTCETISECFNCCCIDDAEQALGEQEQPVHHRPGGIFGGIFGGGGIENPNLPDNRGNQNNLVPDDPVRPGPKPALNALWGGLRGAPAWGGEYRYGDDGKQVPVEPTEADKAKLDMAPMAEGAKIDEAAMKERRIRGLVELRRIARVKPQFVLSDAAKNFDLDRALEPYFADGELIDYLYLFDYADPGEKYGFRWKRNTFENILQNNLDPMHYGANEPYTTIVRNTCHRAKKLLDIFNQKKARIDAIERPPEGHPNRAKALEAIAAQERALKQLIRTTVLRIIDMNQACPMQVSSQFSDLVADILATEALGGDDPKVQLQFMCGNLLYKYRLALIKEISSQPARDAHGNIIRGWGNEALKKYPEDGVYFENSIRKALAGEEHPYGHVADAVAEFKAKYDPVRYLAKEVPSAVGHELPRKFRNDGLLSFGYRYFGLEDYEKDQNAQHIITECSEPNGPDDDDPDAFSCGNNMTEAGFYFLMKETGCFQEA